MHGAPRLDDLHRAAREIGGYAPCEPETHRLPDFRGRPFDCYECEFVARPSDGALVVHLKGLPPLLRNAAFFRYACGFWRDRIGSFGRFEAYYTDRLDSANEIYSLDMVFADYYPAAMGDAAFMERHIFRIAGELDGELTRELQGHAVREGRR